MLTFFFAPQLGVSQTANFLDSLSALDSNRFALLEKRATEVIKVNPSLVLEWTKKWQEWAKKEQNIIEEAKAFKYKGKALYHLGELQEAVYAFLEGVQLLEIRPESNIELIAEYYQKIGVIYNNLGFYDLAEEMAHKSIKYTQKKANPYVLVMNYTTLGEIYFTQGIYEKALIYFDSCLQIDQSLNDTVSISGDLGVLGRINTRMGRQEEGIQLLEEALHLIDPEKQARAHSKALNALGLGYSNGKDFKNAKKYIKEALDVSIAIKDTHLTINRLINLGGLYAKLDDYELAEDYLLKSLRLVGNTFKPYRNTIIYKNLSEVYQKKKQFEKAIFYNKKALQIAEEKGFLPEIQLVYQNLMEINKKQGNYKKALVFAEKLQTTSDSLSSANARKKADALNFKYAIAKKEAVIQSLIYANELKEKDLQNNYLHKKMLAITLFLLTALGGLGFYAFQQRQKRLLKEKEVKIEKQLSEITILRQDIAKVLEEEKAEKVYASSLSFEEINCLIAEPLSEREFEVLQHVIKGQNNREIANQIFLSINTIKYHLKNIYAKLDVNNRLQVIQLLLKK